MKATRHASPSHHPPPPGRLVAVDGLKLHLYCTGSGSPTIVLEAGLGDSCLVWAEVQARLSAGQRVCSYDREGIGWSQSGGSGGEAKRAVGQLHSLLHHAGETPPYVLVGHSLGATYARLFALTYPGEVQALVLIEPPILSRVPAAFIALLKAVRLGLAGLSRAGLVHLLGRTGRLSLLFGGASPPEELSQAAGFLYRPKSLRSSIRELEALPETVRLVNELSRPGALHDLPLLVITAHKGRPQTPSLVAGLQQLASLSKRGRIVSVQSSHFVHFEQPETVVAHIEELISAPD